MARMSRRQFVAATAAAGTGMLMGCGRLPFPGLEPQPPSRVYRIGHIAIGGTSTSGNSAAFLERMGGLGYVDGQNLAVEFRSAEFDNSRLPALANELVQRPVEVILAAGTPAHLAAAQATSSIPLVTVVGDPVREGLAASYARPGGNVTGFSTLESTLGPKRLELLRETFAGASRFAVLWNAGNSAKAAEFRETQT